MQTKICFTCKIEKPISEFRANKRNRDKLNGACRNCCAEYGRRHRAENKELYKEMDRKFRKTEKRKQYIKEYRKTEKYKEYHKTEKILNYQKEYRKTDKFKESKKRSYLKNKDKWNVDLNRRRQREQNRYNNDLDYNITKRLRSRFFKATHRIRKERSVLSIIGCTLDEFKSYLESLFTEDMSWELFQKGEIHADHIIPCEAFDMSNAIHRQACFYYKNFQPLWENDNLQKRDIYKEEDKNAYINWYINNVHKK